MAKNPFPKPPISIDASKVSVKIGDAVLKPQLPVDTKITGQQDGIPTPGINVEPDAFNLIPKFEQPVPQQFFNSYNLSPIQADQFKALIQAQSPYVLWAKAAQCPVRMDNGQHDPRCSLCLHGILYFDEKEVPMLVTSSTLQQQFFAQGRYDSGSIMVTSLFENPISFGDRITIKSNKVRDSELRRRTKETLIDPLKFPALDVVLIRTTNTTYIKGADFEITEDGKIAWSKNKSRRPKDGEFYTIVYVYYPVYIITEMLHHHRERRVKQDTELDQAVGLPIQGIAKLFQLVRDEGKDAAQTTYANPFGRP